VVGACSLVNRSIPAHSVAFGTPARVRGRVEVAESGQVQLHIDGED
jgi:acetyltransferase-like isoleucine patch superfamily enzyme